MFVEGNPDRKKNGHNLNWISLTSSVSSVQVVRPIYAFRRFLLNSLHVTGLFLYPLKTSENQRFPGDLKEYIKRQVAWNETFSIFYGQFLVRITRISCILSGYISIYLQFNLSKLPLSYFSPPWLLPGYSTSTFVNARGVMRTLLNI